MNEREKLTKIFRGVYKEATGEELPVGARPEDLDVYIDLVPFFDGTVIGLRVEESETLVCYYGEGETFADAIDDIYSQLFGLTA